MFVFITIFIVIILIKMELFYLYYIYVIMNVYMFNNIIGDNIYIIVLNICIIIYYAFHYDQGIIGDIMV